jgi:hypothetical protein
MAPPTVPAALPVAGLPAPRFDGGSLLNLTATVERALAGAARYPLLADAALAQRIVEADALVLWVIDGLGVEPLQALVPGGALARATAAELTALFPSSTAPTLTTFACGLAPAAHAVPEWFLWFDELGAIYRSLPLDARGDARAHPPLSDAARLYGWASLFARSARPAFAVMPRAIAHTAYSRHAHAGATTLPFDDDAGFVAAVRGAVAAAAGRCYVYAYEDAFDRTAHQHGVHSEAARAVARALDARFVRLLDALAGQRVRVLVTADHGFLDVPPENRLALHAYPRLARCLLRPLCGGPRTPFAYVRPDAADGFAAIVQEALDGRFVAVQAQLLIDAGWLGPDPAAPQLARRLGTHVLLPRDGAFLVDRVPGEAVHPLVGVHGGMSPAEVRVPLVMAQT